METKIARNLKNPFLSPAVSEIDCKIWPEISSAVATDHAGAGEFSRKKQLSIYYIFYVAGMWI